MNVLRCAVTVPDIGQTYDKQFSKLESMGIAVDWKKLK